SHTKRPFRFGVQASTAPSSKAWADLARRTEDLGYAVLTMPDHFTDQLAPVPAMTVAATVTKNLRVCALVFDNDYKHPVVLAKELATMDVLSDGRVDIGLGAGWMRTDYDQAGMQYDSPGVRIDRFVEGLKVIRGCMADGKFSFKGTHYTITDYDGLPKPLQRPCPPVLIGQHH
ncbi:MAG: LLM class flavin-dependent oxidoreductase, partial [Actinomycetota bacterium]